MILLRRFDGSDRQKSQLCQDAIVIMLWSRNLIFTDVILTLGWRPDARLFEWKLNFVYIDFHILCIHRLGGIRSSRWLESMLNLTVLGIGRDVDCAQSFMRSRVTWERSVEVPWYALVIIYGQMCRYLIHLIFLFFWPLGPTRDLKSCPFRCSCVQSQGAVARASL